MRTLCWSKCFCLQVERNCLRVEKIYVADGRKLPQKPLLKGACSVISIGEAPENYMKANCDYVELSEDVDISEVVNTIQEAYDIYGKWEERLNNIINNGNDVQKLLDVTLRYWTILYIFMIKIFIL